MVIEASEAFLFYYNIATNCGELTSPGNGAVVFSGTHVGSTATYSCSEGFVLNGEEFRTCLLSGEWSGDAPTCAGNSNYHFKLKLVMTIEDVN